MRRCRVEIYGSALFVPRTTDPTGVRDQTSFSSGVFLSRRIDIFLLFGFGLSPPATEAGGSFFPLIITSHLHEWAALHVLRSGFLQPCLNRPWATRLVSRVCKLYLGARRASCYACVYTEYFAFDGTHGDVIRR